MFESSREVNGFLARAKSSPADGAPVHVVIGNEAADLDSMTSAIMYGFLAARRAPRGNRVPVPVINIPRHDFELRTEAVYLFDVLGIDVGALTFSDEIDLEALYRNKRLRLTLVDHNILSQNQSRFQGAVEAIIDHHEDSGLYPHATLRRIEPVGSAATLVAEMILGDHPALLEEGTATLLLGTILLDTVNLDPSANRVTPKDTDVANRLRTVARGDPNALFDALQSAKFDVSTLATDDLLRKDYKEWGVGGARYGIGSVLTPLASWIAKDPDVVDGLIAFLRSRDLQCLIAMMAYTDAGNAFHRELAVIVSDPALRARLLERLDATVQGLTPIHPPGLRNAAKVEFFIQEDLSLSRKKLQPIMQGFFSDETR